MESVADRSRVARASEEPMSALIRTDLSSSGSQPANKRNGRSIPDQRKRRPGKDKKTRGCQRKGENRLRCVNIAHMKRPNLRNKKVHVWL